MKHLFKSIMIASLMLTISATTFAQVSATATATANILTPIAIANAGDMNFGDLAVNDQPGTVVLTPGGVRTAAGGVTFLPDAGTVTSAQFTVTGLADATYSITLPSTVTTLNDGGANNMTVNNWTSNPTTSGLLTAGTQTLQVGATLNVGASQPAGVYTSATPFEVTVNYN